jgi:hypothetical protein
LIGVSRWILTSWGGVAAFLAFDQMKLEGKPFGIVVAVPSLN